jgi:hypothetical protein
MSVCFFVCVPGGKRKWGKCDLPATEEQEKHRQGRGEDWGDVGWERWGQNKVPRTHRTIYVQTLLHGGGELLSHATRKVIYLVGWPGHGADQEYKLKKKPQKIGFFKKFPV